MSRKGPKSYGDCISLEKSLAIFNYKLNEDSRDPSLKGHHFISFSSQIKRLQGLMPHKQNTRIPFVYFSDPASIQPKVLFVIKYKFGGCYGSIWNTPNII